MTRPGSTDALSPYSCPYFSLAPTHRDGHEWNKWARVRVSAFSPFPPPMPLEPHSRPVKNVATNGETVPVNSTEDRQDSSKTASQSRGGLREKVAVFGNTDLASTCAPLYGYHVAANSATGRRNPSKQKAHSAPFRLQALFLCPHSCFMAAVRGQTSVWPGPFCPGIPTPRIAATQSRRKDRGSSSTAKGATPMHALIPSKIRALAHRKMALSALRANSSLSVRLKRYNHHIDQARALEAQGGVQ
jgi:hypothetical protein